MKIRVVNRYKWTQFKKKVVGTSLIAGVTLSFGVENGGMVYGYVGLGFVAFALLVFRTIDEWYI